MEYVLIPPNMGMLCIIYLNSCMNNGVVTPLIASICVISYNSMATGVCVCVCVVYIACDYIDP